MKVKNSQRKKIPLFRYISTSLFFLFILSTMVFMESRKSRIDIKLYQLKTQLSRISEKTHQLRKIRGLREDFYFYRMLIDEPSVFINNFFELITALNNNLPDKVEVFKLNMSGKDGVLVYKLECKVNNGEELKNICSRLNNSGDVGYVKVVKYQGRHGLLKGEMDL